MPKFRPEIQQKIHDLKAVLVDDHDPCDGTGYIPTAVPGQVCRCECMILFRYLKELVKAYLPKVPYWTLNLENLEVDDLAKKVVGEYIDNLGRAVDNGLGLLMIGPNGIGKTSVMVEIGKEALIRKYKVRYFTLSSYIDAVFQKDKELVEDYEAGDILLIDELDKTNQKVERMVDEFLRRMSNAGKSIILATNWSKAEIEEALGQSTVSLLKRNCKTVPMMGGDYGDIMDETWRLRLTEDFDYWHESIRKAAMRMEEAAWRR